MLGALAVIAGVVIVVGALLLATSASTSGPTVTRIEGLACGRALVGKGFVVDDLVVTNAHVVAGASELVILDPFGGESLAVVVGFDPAADLAALRPLGRPPLSPVSEFGDADSGDTGSVVEKPFEVRRRIRANIGDIYGEAEVVRPSLEIAAQIGDGDSGAPLVNSSGQVVGVVYASSRGKADTAYAIRSGEVERFLAGVSAEPVEVGPCR